MTAPDSATLTVTADNFMRQVVEASARVPTLVGFWAPWCGPCQQLMPILDKLATEYAGRFKLAKVDIQEQHSLARQVGVRNVPCVVLFKDRTAVDHFIGIQSEAHVRALLDKHLSKMSDGPRAMAQRLKEAGDFAGARQVVEALLARATDDIALQVELAELRGLDGDLEGAHADLQRLQASQPRHAAVQRLTAQLEFSDVIAAHPDIRSLRECCASRPEDLDLRHALAVHQLLGGDVAPALQAWLKILHDFRGDKRNLARRSLVQAFELIGPADPIVAQTRRAMAKMLF